MTDSATQPVFDLLTEAWIPVIDLEGRERTVSLRDALVSAHEYRDLAGELPTMRFALLRILLSVAYRVLDDRPREDPVNEWAELWEADALPAAAFDRYFDEWRHRFDLLDPEQPFLQTPTLRTAKGEWKPISLIVADADTDGALFTMRSELESLSYAEAARWLVHAHAYDYSGIKSGAVGDPRVKGGKGYPMGVGWAGWLGGTVVCGDDLRETLLLNLILGRTAGDPNDLPIWERPVTEARERTPAEIGGIGPISLMSWPQRRIRLLACDDGRILDVLVSNGDPLEYTLRRNDETMTGWRFSEPQTAKFKDVRYMPRRIEPGQVIWRGLSTVLPTGTSADAPSAVKKKWNVARMAEPAANIEWISHLVVNEVLPEDKIIELSVVSIEYGTQQASYAEVISDRLGFAAALAAVSGEHALIGIAHEAAGKAEAGVQALRRLAADLERAAGGSGDGAAAHASNDAYAALDRAYREWLLRLLPGLDAEARAELLREWNELVRGTVSRRAAQLANDAPESAWIGRPSAMGGNVVSVGSAMGWFEYALRREFGARPGDAVSGARTAADESEEHEMEGAE